MYSDGMLQQCTEFCYYIDTKGINFVLQLLEQDIFYFSK